MESSSSTRMKTLNPSLILPVISLLSLIVWAISAHTHEDFLQCISLHFPDSNSISKAIYTPDHNSSYESVLQSSIRMEQFLPSFPTPKPQLIITPLEESDIQAAIKCSKQHGMQIRVRSGGHDYEGLSSISYQGPFVILDLVNLRSIAIDHRAQNSTAWVQAGATLGELYHAMAEKSPTLGYPAGVCPTVGVGGHFSGGGWGMMARNYGLASDNIIDARLIDANGRIMDRKSMGEDLFWAIRGGGGASFGVITAWQIKLVTVPEKVTVFDVFRSLAQNATQIVNRWQYVSGKIDRKLTIRLFLRKGLSKDGNITVEASFVSLYLGGIDTLLPLMQQSFPELGLARSDCTEMSYVDSSIYLTGLEGMPRDVLLSRTWSVMSYFKGKSDYVTEPIPETGLEAIWKRLMEYPEEMSEMQWSPFGGRMSEISVSETPFQHRAGTLYSIHYAVWSFKRERDEYDRQVRGIRRFYDFMAPYVTKNPRSAYLNYRDLDVGVNNNGSTSYEEASVWGLKYYGINFKRLVHVKTKVDPDNFFRNEQSIPPVAGSASSHGYSNNELPSSHGYSKNELPKLFLICMIMYMFQVLLM